MRRVLRAPLLHFLLLGAVVLAVRSRWDGGAVHWKPRIVLTADDLARLRETWAAEHGTPPGAAAEQALVRDAIDEEILYREALVAGIDRRDAAVDERLVRLGGFLGEDQGRGRDALEREGRRLGLERSDVVIRRHLVEMMRLATLRPEPADLPTERELQDYLDRHAAEFAAPPELRLTQVYLSAAAHGPALDRDAVAVLAQLRRTGAGPEAAATAGDAFIQGADVGPASTAEIGRLFGSDFARAIDGAPLATWVGPVRSSYGLHLVWVRERGAARLPSLAAVRNRVLLALLAERGRERSTARMRGLRARYEVDMTSIGTSYFGGASKGAQN
jgi:hypothetical protein